MDGVRHESTTAAAGYFFMIVVALPESRLVRKIALQIMICKSCYLVMLISCRCMKAIKTCPIEASFFTAALPSSGASAVITTHSTSGTVSLQTFRHLSVWKRHGTAAAPGP